MARLINAEKLYASYQELCKGIACMSCPFLNREDNKCELESMIFQQPPAGQKWIPCSEPPQDDRNVFIAHGTNDFKSCCIGHYEHGMKQWYEDKNWFASPIYDCKYWCDIPELPDMGDKQFEMPLPEPYKEVK